MTESCSEGLLGTWTPPECPFKVSYSLRTIDDIRLAVMDAFFSLPRGGAEIGGILLGKRDGPDVAILDRIPLDCEHAFGPSFSLSPRDLARFSLQMEEAKKNVPDLQPVGWYHSHTRSDIFLSDADLEIHKRYFPSPWQVALVLKPHTFQPMRAGFFFREPDGTYHIGASYLEFILDPQPMRPVVAGATPAPSGAAENRPIAAENRPPVEIQPAGEIRLDAPPTGRFTMSSELPVAEHAPVSANGAENVPLPEPETAVGSVPALSPEPAASPAPLETPAPEAAESKPTPARAETSVDDVPFHYQEVEPRRRGWQLTAMLVLVLATGMALGAFAFETRNAWLPKVWSGAASTPKIVTALGLDLKDQDGELRILWDPKNPAIAAASRGTLEIASGGGLPSANQLDVAELASGQFTFKRDTDRVDVVLSVEGVGGELGREATVFRGKLQDGKSAADAELTKERDSLAEENERLKQNLKEANAKYQQLSRSIDQHGGAQAEAEHLRTQLTAETTRNTQLQQDLNREKEHTRVLGKSVDDLNVQLKQQQRKRITNQAGDTAKQ